MHYLLFLLYIDIYVVQFIINLLLLLYNIANTFEKLIKIIYFLLIPITNQSFLYRSKSNEINNLNKNT